MSGVASLGLIILPVSPGGQFDCGEAYKGFRQKLDRKYAELSPERLAALSRKALRVYDACQTHDLRDAKALFESLDTWTD
jgi:hypothetical protein